MRASGRGNPIRLFAPELTVVVAPDKPVTGVVRDEATRTPLAGVRVSGASLTGEIGQGSFHFHAWPTPATTTDKEGRFTLRGLSKAKAYILVADPEEGSEHLHRFDQVEDTTGFDPIMSGFSLPRGVVLTGRVTDAVTGAGVASRVFYRPLEKNDHLFGGYGPPDYPAPWHWGRDTKTDMEGRYKITVAAGVGVVNFRLRRVVRRTQATSRKSTMDRGLEVRSLSNGRPGGCITGYMHAYKVITPRRDRKATG